MSDLRRAEPTYGPWKHSNANGGATIWTADKYHKIATVHSLCHRSQCEKGANADLIAAAPELLEALKGVLRVADRETTEFDAARAAVARAEGRSA